MYRAVLVCLFLLFQVFIYSSTLASPTANYYRSKSDYDFGNIDTDLDYPKRWIRYIRFQGRSAEPPQIRTDNRFDSNETSYSSLMSLSGNQFYGRSNANVRTAEDIDLIEPIALAQRWSRARHTQGLKAKSKTTTARPGSLKKFIQTCIEKQKHRRKKLKSLKHDSKFYDLDQHEFADSGDDYN